MTVVTAALRTAPPAETDLVVTDTWRVGDRVRQRALADAAMAAWARDWPAGLLRLDCLLSTDGELVLYYARWADEAAYRASGPDRTAGAMPGAEHLGTITSRVHGPLTWSADAGAAGALAGCTVLVTIGTDGRERQEQVAATIAAHVGGAPHPGGVGGHLLFSTDGTRVLNYAEWTSEEAHREALAGPNFGKGQENGIFHGMPGIRGLSMNRYQLYRRLTRAE